MWEYFNNFRSLEAAWPAGRRPVQERLRNEAGKEAFALKCLLIVYSYHHNNTQKVAEAMAKVLGSEIQTPQQANPEDLQKFDLVGFGSGIDSGKNYPELLAFASKLPQAANRKAFVFSTSGMPIGVSGQQRLEEYMCKCHTTLKEILQAKGYTIVGEFGCAGFNTNKFLKYFGGLNKGRPNEEDLEHAEPFAENLNVSKNTQKLAGGV